MIDDQFPISAPAPEQSGYQLGSDESVKGVVEKFRENRGPENTLDAEGEAYARRLIAERDYLAAKTEDATDKARAQIKRHAEHVNEVGIHTAAFGDGPNAVIGESDFDADGFGRTLGLPDAGQLTFDNADAALGQAREAINAIMDSVTDEELLAYVSSPKVAAFRADIEKQLDRSADNYWGYGLEADETQKQNREITLLNAARIHAAHAKLGRPMPSTAALIARARIAADETYSPGKRGASREFAKPQKSFSTIHHALQNNVW